MIFRPCLSHIPSESGLREGGWVPTPFIRLIFPRFCRQGVKLQDSSKPPHKQWGFYSPGANAGDDDYRTSRCNRRYFVERGSGSDIFCEIPVPASKCQRNFQPERYPNSCPFGSRCSASHIAPAKPGSRHWHVASLGLNEKGLLKAACVFAPPLPGR